jgi:hypothetical protein
MDGHAIGWRSRWPTSTRARTTSTKSLSEPSAPPTTCTEHALVEVTPQNLATVDQVDMDAQDHHVLAAHQQTASQPDRSSETWLKFSKQNKSRMLYASRSRATIAQQLLGLGGSASSPPPGCQKCAVFVAPSQGVTEL